MKPQSGGKTDLTALLRGMSPLLEPGEFVFATAPPGQAIPAGCDPMCAVRERQGLTLILPRAEAERLQLPFAFVCRKITLQVHSDLAAVGFLAKITSELAARGIAVNVVSGYHHDHLFVPADRAEDAMNALEALGR